MRPQLIVLVALCVAANGLALYGSPALLRTYPYIYTATGSSLATPTQQQYLSQDQLGQYAYGYVEPLSSKQESRSIDGITRGSYSYRDATGQLQTVDYTADEAGFHVAATNLPQQFRTDTVQVAAARQSHLAAHEEARLRLASHRHDQHVQPNVRLLEVPHPVADTAEVAAAKSVHLKRVEAEKLRNELLGPHSSYIVPNVYSYSIPRYYTSGFYY
ncbi:cuticle protein 7 [Scaptodrosophila lebanonensis]|uniref:Cuticle protein 7 n=1 Tax=Drosophila lebanonensis TaxID=7225 RepID=A0A6J2UB33_DROLE|nr:cuticle protein 7 [Scaptodrosophila lebanonensis]